MLGQPRPQQKDENLTVDRSSQLHQVTASTTTRPQRPRRIAESACPRLAPVMRATAHRRSYAARSGAGQAGSPWPFRRTLVDHALPLVPAAGRSRRSSPYWLAGRSRVARRLPGRSAAAMPGSPLQACPSSCARRLPPATQSSRHQASPRCQWRANHQDLVTTYHRTGGEAGAIAPSRPKNRA
jgi:hypothetical protein